ncbi:hypothetical protein [Arcobacter arenosus]|uniref:Uncharacterized protein n=1 Tax=Arcobacter arenosus TaxID=2576037 RepID=A0A5R8Y4J8_9BACT|nr:hypothetical protein [Arcobacter arenosus]TLP41054.1 hypothetical protein FDK22_03270 [Arcobacter arenosus]
MRRRRCKVCNELFTPYRQNNIICKSETCKKIHRREKRRKEEREFNCIICGTLTWTAKDDQITCASKECTKQHALNANKRYVKQMMAYSKKHNYSNKDTHKKVYSDEEMVYILVEKHFNSKNKDIAKKLKRHIKSISYKFNEMQKNKEEYSHIFREANSQISLRITEQEFIKCDRNLISKKDLIQKHNNKLNKYWESVA